MANTQDNTAPKGAATKAEPAEKANGEETPRGDAQEETKTSGGAGDSAGTAGGESAEAGTGGGEGAAGAAVAATASGDSTSARRAANVDGDSGGVDKVEDKEISTENAHGNGDGNSAGSNDGGGAKAERDIKSAESAPPATVPAGDEPTDSVPRVVFNFPGILSDFLIDDWEYVTKQHKLVQLPREPTVAGILNAWIATEKNEAEIPARMEIARGLMDIFNASLGCMLLYRFEREQYNGVKANIIKDKTQFVPAHVYGVEHLIRMLMRIPAIFLNLGIPEPYSHRILAQSDTLLRFIVANGKAFFTEVYVKADPKYLEFVSSLK